MVNLIAIVRMGNCFMGLIGIDRSERAIGSLNNIGERGDRKKVRLMIGVIQTTSEIVRCLLSLTVKW